VSRSEKNAGKLKQFLLRSIPGWQVPREWWFVDSLAENERGKVSRAAWRRRFLSRNGSESPRKAQFKSR
jgi:acyl-CoA synthetase (AMP-forming)/AMP-acid ligase II